MTTKTGKIDRGQVASDLSFCARIIEGREDESLSKEQVVNLLEKLAEAYERGDIL
jgi:hypothetical protein